MFPHYRILSLLMLIWLSSSAMGQSLFDRRSPNRVDRFRNYAARHRGDLLTVIINESTDVENRDERSMDKAGNSSNNAGFNVGASGDIGAIAGDALFGHATDSARSFSGDSEFRSQRALIDRFSVQIQDVLPNGNMVIAGYRTISIQGDQRKLRLSGVVRQFDVLPNNMVPSHLIANMKVELEAKGPEQAYGKQGWFSRKINKLWPF
ncbi:MAG: flagellar basal body L-ring protein FlgH [Planctomycetota bacterium]|nr:flagellar basal body L-ring protein FlgH [Planctomycetota bacterium]